jgi:1-deoxy-D-xylulose-5-phosphate synthase
VLALGLPDHFIDHGDQQRLLASVGLDAAGVVAAIEGLSPQ